MAHRETIQASDFSDLSPNDCPHGCGRLESRNQTQGGAKREAACSTSDEVIRDQGRLVESPSIASPEISESYTSNRSFLQSFEKFQSASENSSNCGTTPPPTGRWKLTPLPSHGCLPEVPLTIHSSKGFSETSTEYTSDESITLWRVSQEKAKVPRDTDSRDKGSICSYGKKSSEHEAYHDPSDDEGEDERFYRQSYEHCRSAHRLMSTFVLKKAKEMSQRRKSQR
ncbi:Hypothetical predicted protein [Drosophila guanche]|uniref:Uncharacterized protein n=1 Tax=Drosophila guanche TaxID=7266 RepID=A0A3B0K730_DROGU|nr:Hypothetical predicted protein [Drosophila guanche]